LKTKGAVDHWKQRRATPFGGGWKVPKDTGKKKNEKTVKTFTANRINGVRLRWTLDQKQ